MSDYWQKAQERSRQESGTGLVFTQDGKAALAGNKELGWMIIIPEGSVEVKTTQGVDMMLEELALPHLGWH